MRREAGRAHLERQLAAEAARDAQAPRLVLEAEAVAGLDLERGDAFGHQHPCTRGGKSVQLRIAGRARRRDGRADAAAGAGDVLVARAFEAQLELARAVAAVDQVGMAVDQARRHERAAEVVLGADREPAGRVAELAFGADPAQGLAVDEQRAVLDPAPRHCAGFERREAGVAPQADAHRDPVSATGIAASSHQAVAAAGRCAASKRSLGGARSNQSSACAGTSIVSPASRQRPATAVYRPHLRQRRAPGDAVGDREHPPRRIAQHQVQVERRAVEQPAGGRRGAIERNRRVVARQAPRRAVDRQLDARPLQHREPALHAGKRRERTVGLDLGDADAHLPVRGRPGQQLARVAAAVAPGLRDDVARAHHGRHGLNLPSIW